MGPPISLYVPKQCPFLLTLRPGAWTTDKMETWAVSSHIIPVLPGVRSRRGEQGPQVRKDHWLSSCALAHTLSHTPSALSLTFLTSQKKKN